MNKKQETLRETGQATNAKSRVSDAENKYDSAKIEAKWKDKWQKEKIYSPNLIASEKPFYNLMMFPYPSAEGLHVGNMYAFVGSDIYGRFIRMQGKDVFEPIGLDGFGIHSENYAMKIGKHPADLALVTKKNFYRQLQQIGNGFDWSKTLETFDPNYYRWTQWVFTQLFKAGLAYRGEGQVNWCPSCLTVLADEQVIAKQEKVENKQETIQVCERCGTEVIKKNLTQWYFRITQYSQQLLDGLEKIDWSEKVSVAQRNWLGKSEGAEILFSIDIEKEYLVRIFTTRPDTLLGVTFLALAMDHPLVTRILDHSNGQTRQAIRDFLADNKPDSVKKSGSQSFKARDGVYTGFNAKHPITGESIPVYIANYVLTGYGTGAIMGVPAHDERDFEFANKYELEIKQVIMPEQSSSEVSQDLYTGYGKLVNSDNYNGLESKDAILQMCADLEKKGLGKKTVNWHLRDWIISRQRYWGPPIPMIFCQKCADEGKSWFTEHEEGSKGSKVSKVSKGAEAWKSAGWYPVEDDKLPVELPYIKNFKPTGSGVSPLAQDVSFINTKCPGCGADAKRETDVSDTFLDSSWYFLRYPSVNQKTRTIRKSDQSESLNIRKSEYLESSEKLPWNSEITKKWLPVEMYIGGAEHSVLHLLYARFITKVFKDLGLIDFDEPFTKFRAHGLLIKDGAKMSKSKGNVINPDDYIAKFGADTLRAYLMFCGRYSEGGDFRDEGIEGMQKFLKRVWRIVQENLKLKIENLELDKQGLFMMHKTIKKVSEDIENLSYNTAIAALMEWVNFLEDRETGNNKQETKNSKRENGEKVSSLKFNVSGLEVETLLKLLAPFAPYMTEELWQANRKQEQFKSIHVEKWPKYKDELANSDKIILIVQVNGKVRDKIETDRGISRDLAIGLAKKSEKVSRYIKGASDPKIIYVEGKLLNFVLPQG